MGSLGRRKVDQELYMIIHYLEDNLDWCFQLHHSVSKRLDAALTTSQNLEEMCDYLSRNDADLILVDIRRPDALSLKDDVQHIRKFSKKPILFITNANCDLTEERARQSGALGVLDKNQVSIDGFLDEVTAIYDEQIRRV
ncbi:MAG: hypothetical protein CBB65_01455 [Hyphomonadaceae bacterium TMED5]|nr:MAG: hypothetical protein CBB65_01455 [Hyphomonadaceae bacterium TMED5]|tara:strand:- start:133717 stop:134136 length:420 start_codon:yes stop_codon:yes gene_type:complete